MFSVKLDEITGEGLDLRWQDERPALLQYIKDLPQIDFDFETPLKAEAKVTKAGKNLLIDGNVQVTLRFHCMRCLKEFSYPLSAAMNLMLSTSKAVALAEEIELDEENTATGFFDGEEIRLSEIACEQVFLEIPFQPLCSEECKGLCPTCGKDLNLSSCHCSKEERESGFSALLNLKLERPS